MRTLLKFSISYLLLSFLWLGFLFLGILQGWWHRPLTSSDHPEDFYQQVVARVEEASPGSAVLAQIEGGEVVHEYFDSKEATVDRHTAYQVASLSKWVTAWGVMALVEDGLLDLDAPVDQYLSRWNLPKSDFDNSKVSARLLLAHMAGLTDGLGYAGFDPGQSVQQLEESLTKAIDASPGANGEVRVGIEPGTEWRYSGGGYTLLQLLIEEVSGETFQQYMTRRVFKPLGMTDSTFIWDEQGQNLAQFYDAKGNQMPHLRYTSLAATSLYTSLHDMELFALAHFEGPNGETVGRGVLSGELLSKMSDPQAFQMGAAIWGMGPMLYASNNRGGYIIGHDGKNEPAINTTVRLDPESQDGFILLEMGVPLLATEIGSEWVFWKTGNVDSLLFLTLVEKTQGPALLGLVVIFLLLLLLYWRKSNRPQGLKHS